MLPPLYPILDVSLFPSAPSQRAGYLRGVIAELLSAGVTLLQYRNKQGSEAEILSDAAVLREAAPSSKCVLILNDYPHLITRTGFDGVHVGQQDMPPEQARNVIGPDRILGISTHNPDQFNCAALTSADYLAIGPVFRTSSKLNPDPVIGIEGVRLARLLSRRPLVAIGGIDLENCRAVIDAGADSVAVISALFRDASGRSPAKVSEDFFAKIR